MKYKAPKTRKGTGKPAKRVSAVSKKRPGGGFKPYLVRSWWILRGAAAGTLVLVLFYGAYLGAGKIMALDSLAVKVVEVDGCQTVQPDSIRRLAGVLKGDALLKVDLENVRRKILSHPSVRDATVVRQLPGTLRISVKERVSAAVVLGREFALVDPEGVVISLQETYPEGYPVITGVSEPLVPGRVIMELLPAIEVLGSISRSGLIGQERISELEVDGDRVRVSLMGSGTVIIVGRHDTDAQVKKLVRLMEAGAFDSTSAGYDLRFKGRVIGLPEGTFDMSGGNGRSPAGG